MKGWFKLLVLATIPILAVTAVVNQGLAADKGSQLIFQSNMGHHELHLRCKRAAGQHGRGYGAGSVLQQRDGDGCLVSESDPPRDERSGRPLRPCDSGLGGSGKRHPGHERR